MFKVFREPQAEELIVIGADPADAGSSYCAAHALSKKQADVFMVFHARTDSAQFGYEIYKMARYINRFTGNWPCIGVERNIGSATINVLQTLNYSNLFRMPKLGMEVDDKEQEKIGWLTTAQTRPKMLDELGLALAQGLVRIYDEDTVKELFSFIRNQRTGRPEAAEGSDDDLVMALAIAWQLHGLAKVKASSEWDSIISRFPKQKLFDKKGLY
jgi:hypothetical protein